MNSVILEQKRCHETCLRPAINKWPSLNVYHAETWPFRFLGMNSVRKIYEDNSLFLKLVFYPVHTDLGSSRLVILIFKPGFCPILLHGELDRIATDVTAFSVHKGKIDASVLIADVFDTVSIGNCFLQVDHGAHIGADFGFIEHTGFFVQEQDSIFIECSMRTLDLTNFGYNLLGRGFGSIRRNLGVLNFKFLLSV